MEQEPAPQPQSRPLLTQKPKRTVTLGACVACRKRKSKCDGSRPTCTCCAQKDTECIYELGPNEKPSQAMKRKNEEMQGELLNLRQLYDFLRLRPEHEAQDVLKQIRSNPVDATPTERIQELADYVRLAHQKPQLSLASAPQQTSGLITLPPLRIALESHGPEDNGTFPGTHHFPGSILSTDYGGPSSQRRRHASDADVSAHSGSQSSLRRSTSIGALLHHDQSPPPDIYEAGDRRLRPACRWTSITDDVGLVVELLKSWHRWEYWYWHFMDWVSITPIEADYFLDDMDSGETNFCSELLVNAILASASFQSSDVQNRSTPFTNNIITRFYTEAMRLWESEERKDSLTSLQSAMLLYLVLGKNGRDKVGYTLLVDACRMARNLGLSCESTSAYVLKPSGVSDDRWGTARAVTAWALFNFQLSMSYTYSFPAILKTQPQLPIPYNDAPNAEAIHFRSECQRQVIMAECASALWDAGTVGDMVPSNPNLVEVLYLRLKSWWDSRPVSLDPLIHSSPENLVAAMIYYVTLIRLVHPFLNLGGGIDRTKPYQDRAQSIYYSSMQELRHLLELQDVRYGWSSAIAFVLHPIIVISWCCLEDISLQKLPCISHESDRSYRTLLICLRALSRLSSCIFYAQPLFRLISQTCLNVGIRLPSEITNSLDYYQSKEWTTNAAKMISSQYVADMHCAATGIEHRSIDTIIAHWGSLTLEDKGRTETIANDSKYAMHFKG
ncbi:hypothetical protein K491DRAFT_719302 [Lophiostoma macrostomum CBS 122681]|uniref:Zn(2)-C6 fungal-type domain-containing protein n=1 Tax=Lophiostoma macrostomum CBS 122681 TaxID=1314788 RepID=A0A6A6SYB3_9PLEO|nr:hypothetical protein K491DRAFT_719302 [Lophiostoma macrostomum CBS 122681]